MEKTLHDQPLIESQTIDDKENHRFVSLEMRDQKAIYHLQGQRRPVSCLLNPIAIVLFNVLSKRQIALASLINQGLFEPKLRMLIQLNIPLYQLRVNVDPLLIVKVIHQSNGNSIELLYIVLGNCGTCDLLTFEELLACYQHLAGINRFNEVVADLYADRLFHQRFFLILRNHHHWKIRSNILDLSESPQSPQTCHHLVEEDQIKAVVSYHGNGVFAVGCGIDRVTFFL